MSCRLAINGYGRIGRCILRAYYEASRYASGDSASASAAASNYQGMRLVAINDLADARQIAHLTRYDSTHGRFPGDVRLDGQTLLVEGDPIALSRHAATEDLPWRELDVDLVLECSGSFSDRAGAQRHLDAGAKRVLFSQPAEADVDATIVYGINHHSLEAGMQIVSAASCTSNCVVPVLAALDEELGIESAVITTIHSAMNDQPVIDSYHHADLRRTRSAMQSIIPVDTALAVGIERILPRLSGKLQAQALRVPTVNVSAMDLTVVVARETSIEALKAMFHERAASLPPNVMGVTEEPLASCDFNHDPRSAIVDLTQTRVAPGGLIKMLVWFDNEWAYANRMLDVAQSLCDLKAGELN